MSEAHDRILERGVMLADSVLWRMQDDYFVESGARVWSANAVPSYVTSNPVIARVYARVFAAWLRDFIETAAATFDPGQPVYLVELGAGSGRLAFHFLQSLYALLGDSALAALEMLETGNYGSAVGILPCGLAARNTLRLESAMSLYGHELDDDITPLEAGLGWITKLDKEGGFTGRNALAAQKESALTRKIAGFEMTEPGIARDGYDVYVGDEKVGIVTSGSPAPFLKKNIGLAFLPPDLAKIGQEIRIEVRGNISRRS